MAGKERIIYEDPNTKVSVYENPEPVSLIVQDVHTSDSGFVELLPQDIWRLLDLAKECGVIHEGELEPRPAR